jgi:hypothetical protein
MNYVEELELRVNDLEMHLESIVEDYSSNIERQYEIINILSLLAFKHVEKHSLIIRTVGIKQYLEVINRFLDNNDKDSVIKHLNKSCLNDKEKYRIIDGLTNLEIVMEESKRSLNRNPFLKKMINLICFPGVYLFKKLSPFYAVLTAILISMGMSTLMFMVVVLGQGQVPGDLEVHVTGNLIDEPIHDKRWFTFDNDYRIIISTSEQENEPSRLHLFYGFDKDNSRAEPIITEIPLGTQIRIVIGEIE